MDTIKLCPKCASPLPADAPSGVCPKCLLNAGFESQSGLGANPMSGFTPPDPSELAKHFPQLEIMEMLGAGGMGVVYKARQVALDRVVALKILPPSAGSDPAFAERFAREARALAKLSHPNIVGVYDFGQAGPYYYFLMEFIDGVNLRQMISAQRIEPREALAIIPQICDALQYAHDLGVVHRDIKPENLLMDRRGRVRIADFGLARLLGSVNDPRLTQSQHAMGTPHYMAPEQFEKPLSVDHRADIYSLGVVLYEMLTGELPLGRFELPSHKVQVDVRLDDIVLKTLAKEPERRYQHASEVKSEVETLAGIPLSQLPPGFRNALGIEYKSKTTLFGLPLLHVSMGYDPQTGKQRRARGIVAIGGTATGVVAMGGKVCGVIAFGGMAAGVIAIGGLSFGVFSLGGLALALAFAWGGFAIGPIAYGGCAIGYLAAGGLAFGVHAIASNTGEDKIAHAFFKPLFSGWATALMIVLINVPICINLGIAAWARAQQNKTPAGRLPSEVSPRFSRTAIFGACWAALFALSVIFGLIFFYVHASTPTTRHMAGSSDERGAPTFDSGPGFVIPVDKTGKPVLSPPIAKWRGEENAEDENREFNGELVGAVQFVPGVRGQAFQFNGLDAFVRIPDSPALHFMEALSIEMWFKRDDAQSFGGLIDKRDVNNQCNFGVHMSKDWDFHVYFLDPKNVANGKFQNSFSPLPTPGVFHYLVATFQQFGPSPGLVEVKTFLDGRLVKSESFSGNLANTLNNEPICIGTVREGKLGDQFASQSMFRGVIDEVALYDRVMAPEEILAHYNAFKPSPTAALRNGPRPQQAQVPSGEPNTLVKILFAVFGIIGLPAPIGTTVCGIVAIGQIRRLKGRIYGLPLALADALLFPLLFLNAIIVAGAGTLAAAVNLKAVFGVAAGVLFSLALSAVIVILLWRTVRKPVQ